MAIKRHLSILSGLSVLTALLIGATLADGYAIARADQQAYSLDANEQSKIVGASECEAYCETLDSYCGLSGSTRDCSAAANNGGACLTCASPIQKQACSTRQVSNPDEWCSVKPNHDCGVKVIGSCAYATGNCVPQDNNGSCGLVYQCETKPL